jgi:hypothetical protein
MAVLDALDLPGSGDTIRSGNPAGHRNAAAFKKASPSGKAVSEAFELKITLSDLRPPIWRRVVVPASLRLDQLHQVIQAVMGWEDYHMHVFETSHGRYGRPDRELGHRDSRKVTLSQVLRKPGDRIRYTYDFGDNWEHDIVLEKTAPTVARPTCVTGRRACPPEDCGGVWGYAELLEAIADPAHEQHQELTEWLADVHGMPDFDPAAFDVAAADQRLSAMFR